MMNDTASPKPNRIVLHIVCLIAGVAVLFYLCFAQSYVGIGVPTFQTRVVGVVLAILVFGSYLRRFGRFNQ